MCYLHSKLVVVIHTNADTGLAIVRLGNGKRKVVPLSALTIVPEA